MQVLEKHNINSWAYIKNYLPPTWQTVIHETHYKANYGTAITFEDLLTMNTGIQFGDPSNYSPGPMPTTAEMYRAIGQLKARLAEFVEYYNNQRYHESLDNLTPADVYHGRAESILKQSNRKQ